MALINVVTVDLAAKTINLNSTESGNSVENITYSNVTSQITINSRSGITISASELIDLNNQINILQTAINFNFPGSNFSIAPFSSVDVTETNNTTTWDLQNKVGNGTNLFDYSAVLSNKTEILNKRTQTQTISLAEWLYIVASLNHYLLSVRKFLNI
jgi:hypothetical protein